ncbi:Uncharacterized protein GBIM_10630, partial [Gryllus bimaculatus]
MRAVLRPQVWFNNNGWATSAAYLNAINNVVLRALVAEARGARGADAAEVRRGWPPVAAFGIAAVNHPINNFDAHMQDPDYFIYLVTTALCVIVFFGFHETAYVTPGYVEFFVALVLFYGWATVPMMFPFSFLFREPSTAFVLMACLNLALGMVTSVTVVLLNLLGSQKLYLIQQQLRTLFLIFPQFCLTQGLIDLVVMYYTTKAQLSLVGPGTRAGLERMGELSLNIWYMFGEGIAFFLITLLIEKWPKDLRRQPYAHRLAVRTRLLGGGARAGGGRGALAELTGAGLPGGGGAAAGPRRGPRAGAGAGAISCKYHILNADNFYGNRLRPIYNIYSKFLAIPPKERRPIICGMQVFLRFAYEAAAEEAPGIEEDGAEYEDDNQTDCDRVWGGKAAGKYVIVKEGKMIPIILLCEIISVVAPLMGRHLILPWLVAENSLPLATAFAMLRAMLLPYLERKRKGRVLRDSKNYMHIYSGVKIKKQQKKERNPLPYAKSLKTSHKKMDVAKVGSLGKMVDEVASGRAMYKETLKNKN